MEYMLNVGTAGVLMARYCSTVKTPQLKKGSSAKMILCPQQHKDTIDSVLGAEVHVCVLWLCSNEVQTQSCVIVASALMTSGPGVFTGGPWVTAGQFRTFG